MKVFSIIIFSALVLFGMPMYTMDENSEQINDTPQDLFRRAAQRGAEYADLNGGAEAAAATTRLPFQPSNIVKDLDRVYEAIDTEPDYFLHLDEHELERRFMLFSPAEHAAIRGLCVAKNYDALRPYINETTANGLFFAREKRPATFLKFLLDDGQEELAKGILAQFPLPDDLPLCSGLDNPLFPSKEYDVRSFWGTALYNRAISASFLRDLLVLTKPRDKDGCGHEQGQEDGMFFLVNSLGEDGISLEKKEVVRNYLESNQYSSRYEFCLRSMVLGVLNKKNAVRFLLLRGYFDQLKAQIAEHSDELRKDGGVIAAHVLKDISDYYKGLHELDLLFNESHLVQLLFAYAGEDVFPNKQEETKRVAKKNKGSRCIVS